MSIERKNVKNETCARSHITGSSEYDSLRCFLTAYRYIYILHIIKLFGRRLRRITNDTRFYGQRS
jgi:hypothetical protein